MYSSRSGSDSAVSFSPRCMLLYCYIFFGAIAGVRRLYHLVKLLRLAVCLHLSGFRVHRDGTEVIFLQVSEIRLETSLLFVSSCPSMASVVPADTGTAARL